MRPSLAKTLLALLYPQYEYILAMQDQALDVEVEEGEDDVSFFTDIDELQAHGINAADIKKLKAAGICTVRGVQMTTRRKLCAIKGLSEAKVDKIKEVGDTLNLFIMFR